MEGFDVGILFGGEDGDVRGKGGDVFGHGLNSDPVSALPMDPDNEALREKP